MIFHKIDIQSKEKQTNRKMNDAKKKKLISLGIAAFFVILLLASAGYFANKYFGIFDQVIKIKNPFSAEDFQEVQTVSKTEDGYLYIPAQVINTSSVRFTLDVKSKELNSITARLKFKPGPKEIILGMRGNEKDKFIYKSFYHKFLQDNNWNKIEENGNTLYQKNKNFDSFSKLIAVPPDKNRIASYYINRSQLIQTVLETDLGSKTTKPINVKTGLRGTHAFIVRVDEAPFILKLSKQDMNMYNGEDKYLVSISQEGQLIEEKSIPDDGFIGKEKLKKEPQSVEFTLDDIKPGIYEVLVKIGGRGDSVITSIETNQSKMIIVNRVFTLFTNPITLYTNYSPITLRAEHKDFTQTVKLNDDIPLELESSKKNIVFDLETLVPDKKISDLYQLETPKTNVKFISSGYFSFSKDQYFDPEVIHATDLSTVGSLDEIDYIFTSVSEAQQEGDWLVSEVTFDSKDIKIDEEEKLYFNLAMPNLEKYSGELEIDSFDVDLNVAGVFSDKFGKRETEKETTDGETTIISKISNVPKRVGSFFSTTYQKIQSFFLNTYNRIFRKEEEKAEEETDTNEETTEPTATPSPTPTSVPSPSPTPKPSPSPSEAKSVSIKILNAGAPSGYATKYAGLIKEAGYVNVEASNADGEDFSNAEIRYQSKFETDVEKIEKILKDEYKTVNRVVDSESPGITVKIGAR